MNLADKITQGEWDAVEYCGSYNIQDGPFYESNNILDIENTPKEEVEQNVRSILQVPKLLGLVDVLSQRLEEKLSQEGKLPMDEGFELDVCREIQEALK